jgi:hypothetical protein
MSQTHKICTSVICTPWVSVQRMEMIIELHASFSSTKNEDQAWEPHNKRLLLFLTTWCEHHREMVKVLYFFLELERLKKILLKIFPPRVYALRHTSENAANFIYWELPFSLSNSPCCCNNLQLPKNNRLESPPPGIFLHNLTPQFGA